MSIVEGSYRHGRRPIRGRVAADEDRAASPLELLFDLTFVAAFGVASEELADGILAGIDGPAAAGFVFAIFCIVWAWTNFSWFASAFDNDDWLTRLLTMVQMAGVLVLALGLHPMFASIEHGDHLDTATMVAGYVVMRLGLVLQGVRAAHSDRMHRATVIRYAVVVGVAQLGWITLAALPLSREMALAIAASLFAIEILGPVLAEGRRRRRMPWQPGHIAERYALLTIIALGETVFGTLSSAGEISTSEGWNGDAVAVIAIGVGLSFAMWWCYFLLPHAALLSIRPDKAFIWGCGHVLVFGAIAGTGAGLHAVSAWYSLDPRVGRAALMAAVGVPVLIYMVSLYLVDLWLLSRPPRGTGTHIAAGLFCLAGFAGGVVGSPLWVCLALVFMSPTVVVVTYELGGWRSRQLALDTALDAARPTADGSAPPKPEGESHA
jgi:low temperature requirement protein LtrA